MTRLFVVLVTLASLAAMGPNKPHENNGNDIIADCKAAVMLADGAHVSNDEVGKAQYCAGLVRGVQDVLDVTDHITLPANTSLGQNIRVVTKYLEDHPEELADRDSSLVMRALVGAFPARDHKRKNK